MGNDLDQLQGLWTVSSLEVDGEAMPPAMLAEARIVVTGDRFTSTGMGAVYEGTLTLDLSASPPRIDMKFLSGPEKGNTNRGIYQLDNDSWKLCLATRGKVRPRSFRSKPGTGFALETMVRGKPPKAEPKATEKPAPPELSGGPATEFEGEWTMLSGVMNGKAMDASLVRWVRRVTRGNRTTVMAGPQTMLKVEFSYDSSPSPKTIDYLNLAGSHKGKAQLGIYKSEGDVLTVCISPPGRARPARFESIAGDDRTLTVWKRA